MRWNFVPLKSDKYKVLTGIKYGFKTIEGERVNQEGCGEVKNTECDEVSKSAKKCYR